MLTTRIPGPDAGRGRDALTRAKDAKPRREPRPSRSRYGVE